MNDDGFMMLDAMIAMLMFSMIIGLLVPALMLMDQTVAGADSRLDFNRTVYIDLLRFESFQDFKNNTEYTVSGGMICDSEDPALCISYKK